LLTRNAKDLSKTISATSSGNLFMNLGVFGKYDTERNDRFNKYYNTTIVRGGIGMKFNNWHSEIYHKSSVKEEFINAVIGVKISRKIKINKSN